MERIVVEDVSYPKDNGSDILAGSSSKSDKHCNPLVFLFPLLLRLCQTDKLGL